MIQRRLRVSKWVNITPAVGVCTLCSREFKVPMNALRRTADAQSSLQEQFNRHKCEHDDSHQIGAGVNADALRRQVPDEDEEDEEDEEEDRKEGDDDDGEDEGYSE